VGPGADFLRVACAGRHDKSPAGLRGTLNRGGLLCGLMAKAEQARFADYCRTFVKLLRIRLARPSSEPR
jgi:hypothetical protein